MCTLIGIFSPISGREYVAIGNTIENIIKQIENDVEEWGDEIVDDSRITFYRANMLNVRKQYVIIEE